MAHKYYDSGSAGSSAPYESETTAATTLADALGAINGADQIIWVKNTSAESIAEGVTFSSSSTYATAEKPQRIYGVSDWDSSPGTLAGGASITMTANSFLGFEGFFDVSNVALLATSSFGSVSLGYGSTTKDTLFKFADGGLSLAGGGLTQSFRLGTVFPANSNKINNGYIKDSFFSFTQPGQHILCGVGEHLLENVSIGGSAPTTLLKAVNSSDVNSYVNVTDSDFVTNAPTNFADLSGASSTRITVERCKTSSGMSWITGSIGFNSSLTIINSSSSDVSYAFANYNYAGTILHDPSVYASSSPIQTKGGVPYSVLFVSSANSGRGMPLKRPFIVPVDDNATVTPFVEFLVQGDGAASLNTDDVYITAQTCTEAGSTLGSTVSSHPGLITAGSAISAGTVSYTGDGYTTERTHKLTTAAITARQEGYIKITVHLVKPSTGIYIGQFGAS